MVDIEVDGMDGGKTWHTAIELDYANEESLYCRSKVGPGGERLEVPASAAGVRLAYLPPMSGLASNETRLDEGAIGVRIGHPEAPATVVSCDYRQIRPIPRHLARLPAGSWLKFVSFPFLNERQRTGLDLLGI